MAAKCLSPVYLKSHRGTLQRDYISVEQIFGMPPDDPDIYFSFENQFTPFQPYIEGSLPRTDLVIQNRKTGVCLSAFEVKLTALPDHTTCEKEAHLYGSEMVVRPDTIAYLACSLASSSQDNLKFLPQLQIKNWTDPKQVLPNIATLLNALKQFIKAAEKFQNPFLIQPVWKTNGKSSELSEQCLDVFVWSNTGFAQFMTEIANSDVNALQINRPTRAAIWLYKMLDEIKNKDTFNHQDIIDALSFNTKNDKAFASSGQITNPYMRCDELTKPRISKKEIKNIILGGGEKLLSPERRFDAIIVNSPSLFV